MKRIALGVLLAVMMAVSAAAFSADQDFALVNKTGLTIDELYISPVNENEWGEDVLGVDTLADGQKADISFDHAETECKWDMKIVDEDGDEVVWKNINLCKIVEITLFYKNGTPTAQIK